MRFKECFITIEFVVPFVSNACALTKNFTFSDAKEGVVTKEAMVVKQETNFTQVIRTYQAWEK